MSEEERRVVDVFKSSHAKSNSKAASCAQVLSPRKASPNKSMNTCAKVLSSRLLLLLAPPTAGKASRRLLLLAPPTAGIAARAGAQRNFFLGPTAAAKG
jgi:hypothetical protein